jgi:hypothetical protein
MALNVKTYLYVVDDHRGFADDVKKKFTDASRYVLLTFQTPEDFLKSFQNEKENKCCRIAVIRLHDVKNEYEDIEHLAIEIKNSDPAAGIILICPPEKLEEIKQIIKFNIDAFIPLNSTAVLRLHNAVKKLISEHGIYIFRRRRNISLMILFAFIVLSVLVLLLAYFRLPLYF